MVLAPLGGELQPHLPFKDFFFLTFLVIDGLIHMLPHRKV